MPMIVLIIEDDRDFIEFISIVFKVILPDCEIDYVCNKTDAFEWLQARDYDVITLDGELDGGDHGRDILKEIAPEQFQKIIACSNDEHFLIECSKKEIKFVDKGKDIVSEFKKILSARGII
jgi:DNA-binding response OmpR family regulator